MTPKCPKNFLLVSITRAYEDELTFASGVKLHVAVDFNPNFHATSIGTVVSVPANLAQNKNTFIKKGDTLIFSYKTVGDISFHENPRSFFLISEEGYSTQWSNQYKEMLSIDVGPDQKKWSVTYSDKNYNLIAGYVGDSQSSCENWISKNGFVFSASLGFDFDNKIEIGNEDYWKVMMEYAFAVKRNDKYYCVNDYALIEPICEKKTDLLSANLYRSEGDKLVVHENKGRLISICENDLGVEEGDIVLFNGEMKESYNIENKPYYIVRKQHIVGREIESSGLVLV